MTASMDVSRSTIAPSATGCLRKRVLGRGTLSLADQAASSAATFLTGAIVGHSCPKEQFGLFALSLTVLAWVTNLQSAFVTTPYLYSNASFETDARRVYAGSTLMGQALYAALATVMLFVAAWAVQHGAGARAFAPILTALGAMLWFLLVKEYCRQISFAHLRMRSALWLDASVGVLQIGGLLALAAAGWMTPSHAYWVIGTASALPTLGWLVAQRGTFQFDRSNIPTTAVRNWEFGRWLLGGYVLNAASRDAYPWLVTAIKGAAATGTLAACTGVAFLVSPIVSGISNVLAPSFAQAYADGGIAALRAMVGRTTAIGVAGIACYCVALWMVGGRAAALIYGSAYADAGTIVPLLGLSVAATVVSLPLGTALYAMRRADINFQAASVAVGVMLLAGLALVKTYGVVGAAVGLLCGNSAESLYKWFRFAHVLRATEQVSIA